LLFSETAQLFDVIAIEATFEPSPPTLTVRVLPLSLSVTVYSLEFAPLIFVPFACH
jgi:hypothetical protein